MGSLNERRYWEDLYYKKIILLGRIFPAEAFFRLALYYQKSDTKLSQYYLERATEFKIPKILMVAAKKVKKETPWRSSKIVGPFLLQAASADYIPAIKEYIFWLSENNNNKEEILKWRERAVILGDIMNLAVLGCDYTDSRYEYTRGEMSKGLAYLSIYLDEVGEDAMKSVYRRVAQRYKEVTDYADDALQKKGV